MLLWTHLSNTHWRLKRFVSLYLCESLLAVRCGAGPGARALGKVVDECFRYQRFPGRGGESRRGYIWAAVF